MFNTFGNIVCKLKTHKALENKRPGLAKKKFVHTSNINI